MTCSACTGSVERCLLAVPGVSAASVNLLAAAAEAWYDSNVTGEKRGAEV
jgi:copper chaperone CopZ